MNEIWLLRHEATGHGWPMKTIIIQNSKQKCLYKVVYTRGMHVTTAKISLIHKQGQQIKHPPAL